MSESQFTLWGIRVGLIVALLCALGMIAVEVAR